MCLDGGGATARLRRAPPFAPGRCRWDLWRGGNRQHRQLDESTNSNALNGTRDFRQPARRLLARAASWRPSSRATSVIRPSRNLKTAATGRGGALAGRVVPDLGALDHDRVAVLEQLVDGRRQTLERAPDRARAWRGWHRAPPPWPRRTARLRTSSPRCSALATAVKSSRSRSTKSWRRRSALRLIRTLLAKGLQLSHCGLVEFNTATRTPRPERTPIVVFCSSSLCHGVFVN